MVRASARAAIHIRFRSKRQMLAISAALKPESKGTKARTVITEKAKKLVLRFEAENSTLLRAIVGSNLRMIRAALNTSNALIEQEQTSRNRKLTRIKD